MMPEDAGFNRRLTMLISVLGLLDSTQEARRSTHQTPLAKRTLNLKRLVVLATPDTEQTAKASLVADWPRVHSTTGQAVETQLSDTFHAKCSLSQKNL